ncbi:MAG: HDIG domain-containing protein [Vicingaceae bacterium]|nr:HDIG domain-containing protein [Vicingaceae bacterium]
MLLSVIVIVFLFPKEGKFKYEFQKNKPWVHQDLLAPFDFAINKTNDEIAFEKQAIKKQQSLYFNIDYEVLNKVPQDLKKWFDENWKDSANTDLKQQSFSLAKQYLDTIYQKGIIQLIDELEGKSKGYVVLIMNGNNEVEELELGNLFTIKSSYDFVASSLGNNSNNFVLEAVESQLKQNVIFNKDLTKKDLNDELSSISLVKGGFFEKQKIISKGEIVNDEKFNILQSLKTEYESKLGNENQSLWLIIGQSIMMLVLFYALFVFLKSVSRNVFYNNFDLGFLLIIIVGFIAITALVLKFENTSVYVIPFCIIPLLVSTFFGKRLALFVFLVTIFIISFFVPNPFEFILLQSITGIVTIFTVLRVNKRAELFYTAIIIMLVISVSYFGLSLIQETSIDTINWDAFGWFGIAAGFTLLTYPLIYLFEKIFGYVSDVTLLELSDTNNKLLKELNLKAPGTFQHSLQVSNLAEEAIQEIGGNPLLVRTGALYHDIGKMYAPAYFIENQSTGVNPHDELGYEESADIIINHVIKGIELAKEYKLPEQIIDFIRTHHGTTKTQYFLRMYKNENPDEEIDESIFEYPGPIPYSKETAVLMMADSVEAASRSLKKYDGDSISNLVNGIIDSQVAQNQFINTNITFRDVTTLKKMFIKKLMNIYHIRIEYPK